MSKIWVEACEGRTVPLHQSVHKESAGVHTLPPNERVQVEDSLLVRRRIRAGDLRALTIEEAKAHEEDQAKIDAGEENERKLAEASTVAEAKKQAELVGYPIAGGIVKSPLTASADPTSKELK